MDALKQYWDQWDAVCSTSVRYGLAKLGFSALLQKPQPAVAELPFVASPTPLLTCIIGYLLIVAVGLALQSNKKAGGKKADGSVVRSAVLVHNVLLIALSGYMCLTCAYEAVKNRYNFWGNEYDSRQGGMARIVYIFYISKLYEFLDTFIMLVKGNVKQVTFLHVYHHASISVIWWSIVYVAPGGDAYYSVVLNSLVHIIMYTYYFMASVIGANDKLRKKYLWWGRYLTMFQMFQFMTMMVQALYLWVVDPRYNMFLIRLLFFYMLTLLALFGNFFYQKHVAGKASKRKAQ